MVHSGFLTLGIESSCDDTSLCILQDEKTILALTRQSQAQFHQDFGGVVPEIAARAHLDAIFPLLFRTLAEAGVGLNQLDLIAATAGPGLVGSLLVGLHLGKTLAMMLKKPFVGVHHLRAHFAANLLESDPELPAIGLLVSGGHSALYLIQKPMTFTLIGETRDDACGEVYDKVGRELGLGVNAGPMVDRMASEAGHGIRFTPPMLHSGDYALSFSGLKTAALLAKAQGTEASAICYGLQQAVVEVLVEKTMKAVRHHGVKTLLLAGGVAANSGLRQGMRIQCERLGIRLHIPSLKLCTDNGAMVAKAGLLKFSASGADPLDTQAFSRQPLAG